MDSTVNGLSRAFFFWLLRASPGNEGRIEGLEALSYLCCLVLFLVEYLDSRGWSDFPTFPKTVIPKRAS